MLFFKTYDVAQLPHEADENLEAQSNCFAQGHITNSSMVRPEQESRSLDSVLFLMTNWKKLMVFSLGVVGRNATASDK